MKKFDLKTFFSPKNILTEQMFRRYSIFSTDEKLVRIAPTLSMFERSKLEPISQGIMSRVYKMKDKDWVVKEGRYDLDIELFGDKRLPLSATLMEKFYNLFSQSFKPTLKGTLDQYRYYLKFVEYFGFFSTPESYFHPNLATIHSVQRHLRNSLLFYKPEIEKHFKFNLNDKIDEILLSDSRLHNFLPKEYLFYGKSISPQNKGRDTSFIVQAFVKGNVIHDVDETNLPIENTRQLILLLYLILLMDYQTGLLPDTRPKYMATQAYDWLLKTENIMLSKDGIKFIDTRWMWDRNTNFVKRGFIIPEMIENLAKGYINFLLDSIS